MRRCLGCGLFDQLCPCGLSGAVMGTEWKTFKENEMTEGNPPKPSPVLTKQTRPVSQTERTELTSNADDNVLIIENNGGYLLPIVWKRLKSKISSLVKEAAAEQKAEDALFPVSVVDSCWDAEGTYQPSYLVGNDNAVIDTYRAAKLLNDLKGRTLQ